MRRRMQIGDLHSAFAIFKFVNFILPIRVSQAEEGEGLDASQHAEKYMQGHLFVTQGRQGI